VEIPVTIQEAILGTSILVPTIHGNVTLKVPAISNNGTNLRLKGKGISPKGDSIFGDQYVSLKVMLPEKIDDKLIEFIESWAKNNDYNPRKKLKIN
jgi:DnaJ-class molecular chaperone